MTHSDSLSRRERQIMDILFLKGEATVREIQDTMDDAPTDMAVRRLLHILEEKGHLNRRKEGRSVVYKPKKSKTKAGLSALSHVVNTFFGGEVEEALAAHLSGKEKITQEQLARMQKMITDAKKQNRT